MENQGERCFHSILFIWKISRLSCEKKKKGGKKEQAGHQYNEAQVPYLKVVGETLVEWLESLKFSVASSGHAESIFHMKTLCHRTQFWNKQHWIIHLLLWGNARSWFCLCDFYFHVRKTNGSIGIPSKIRSWAKHISWLYLHWNAKKTGVQIDVRVCVCLSICLSGGAKKSVDILRKSWPIWMKITVYVAIGVESRTSPN